MRKLTSGSASEQPSTSPANSLRTLRFRDEAQEPLHRLPFIGRRHGEVKFWDVPCTGGYVGGNLTGEALARIFLDTLRQQPDAATPGAWLGWIAMGWMHHTFDMAGVKPDLHPDHPFSTLRGQVVGFASVLSHVLREALKNPDLQLPAFDPEACLRQANDGLNPRTARPAFLRTAGARSGRRQPKKVKPQNA